MNIILIIYEYIVLIWIINNVHKNQMSYLECFTHDETILDISNFPMH